MNNKVSKYTRDDKKHIVELIENLKDDKDYAVIFDIFMGDSKNSYTYNSNGVFLDLSAVTDKTLDKISKYLKKINNRVMVPKLMFKFIKYNNNIIVWKVRNDTIQNGLISDYVVPYNDYKNILIKNLD
jgi:hypothetical protein